MYQNTSEYFYKFWNFLAIGLEWNCSGLCGAAERRRTALGYGDETSQQTQVAVSVEGAFWFSAVSAPPRPPVRACPVDTRSSAAAKACPDVCSSLQERALNPSSIVYLTQLQKKKVPQVAVGMRENKAEYDPPVDYPGVLFRTCVVCWGSSFVAVRGYSGVQRQTGMWSPG